MVYKRKKKKKKRGDNGSVVDRYRKRTGKQEDDFPEAFSPRLHPPDFSEYSTAGGPDTPARRAERARRKARHEKAQPYRRYGDPKVPGPIGNRLRNPR